MWKLMIFFALFSPSAFQTWCGTPDNSPTVDVLFAPAERFALNAPFDIEHRDFFEVRNSANRIVFVNATLLKEGSPPLHFHKRPAMIEPGYAAPIWIHVTPFVYNATELADSEIIIKWVNVPSDVQDHSKIKEKCGGSWMNSTTPKEKRLRIVYNI